MEKNIITYSSIISLNSLATSLYNDADEPYLT